MTVTDIDDSDNYPVLDTKEKFDSHIHGTPLIAFLDILGFKSLVKHNAHSTLIELYKNLVSIPVQSYEKFHTEEQKRLEDELKEKFDPSHLRLVNISDSIILWTKYSKFQSFFEIIYAVKFLMRFAMKAGIPLRGTIVMGSLEILENNGSLSMIGKGLVHAYEYEEQQLWSGCYVDEGIFKFYRSLFTIILGRDRTRLIEERQDLIVKSDIPFKSKQITGYAVNWAAGLKLTEEDIKNSFAQHRKREKEDAKIKADIDLKIKNTIDFFNKYK